MDIWGNQRWWLQYDAQQKILYLHRRQDKHLTSHLIDDVSTQPLCITQWLVHDTVHALVHGGILPSLQAVYGAPYHPESIQDTWCKNVLPALQCWWQQDVSTKWNETQLRNTQQWIDTPRDDTPLQQWWNQVCNPDVLMLRRQQAWLRAINPDTNSVGVLYHLCPQWQLLAWLHADVGTRIGYRLMDNNTVRYATLTQTTISNKLEIEVQPNSGSTLQWISFFSVVAIGCAEYTTQTPSIYMPEQWSASDDSWLQLFLPALYVSLCRVLHQVRTTTENAETTTQLQKITTKDRPNASWLYESVPAMSSADKMKWLIQHVQMLQPYLLLVAKNQPPPVNDGIGRVLWYEVISQAVESFIQADVTTTWVHHAWWQSLDNISSASFVLYHESLLSYIDPHKPDTVQYCTVYCYTPGRSYVYAQQDTITKTVYRLPLFWLLHVAPKKTVLKQIPIGVEYCSVREVAWQPPPVDADPGILQQYKHDKTSMHRSSTHYTTQCYQLRQQLQCLIPKNKENI